MIAVGLVGCGGQSRASDPVPAGNGGSSGAAELGGSSGSGGGGTGDGSGGTGGSSISVAATGGTGGSEMGGLGGQTPLPCTEPAQPLESPGGIGSISTRALTTCVLVDEKVGCFGDGRYGQLGDGIAHPADMDPAAGELVWVKDLDDAAEVHVGGCFACARREDGGAVCWGCSYSGQLGDGSEPTTTISVSGPVPVIGLDDALALAVGGGHACALLEAGSVRCWGEGRQGELGDRVQRGYPGSTGTSVPVDVVEPDGKLLTGVKQVTAGSQHTCALKSDHTVWCWGMGLEGQLGDGSFHEGWEGAGIVYDVKQVLDLDDAVQISAGGAQTCALRASGRVACWGRTDAGTPTAHATDVCGSEGAIQISAGDDHVCARLASGGAICWGYGSMGNLGDGAQYTDFNPYAPAPVTVLGLDDVSEIAAGTRETCATTQDGKVYCWGDGSAGLLGDPAIQSSDVPVEIVAFENVGP